MHMHVCEGIHVQVRVKSHTWYIRTHPFQFFLLCYILIYLCTCLWAWIRQAQEQRLGKICDSLTFLSTLGILRTELSHGFKCLYPLNHLNDAHFGFLLIQNPLLKPRAHQFGETSYLGISLSVLRQYKCLFTPMLEIKLRSSCFLGKNLANWDTFPDLIFGYFN